LFLIGWFLKRSFPLKPLSQMKWNLVGSIYGRSSIKIGHFVPIKNKNGLWWPCLFTDRDKICNLYKGPSIDASYQVSVHLAEGFQRRRLKCEKLTDDGPGYSCINIRVCFVDFMNQCLHTRYVSNDNNDFIGHLHHRAKKDKNRSTKHTHKTKNQVTWTQLKTGGELRCSGRVSSSCSTCNN
jgi:hypothetical protein